MLFFSSPHIIISQHNVLSASIIVGIFIIIIFLHYTVEFEKLYVTAVK